MIGALAATSVAVVVWFLAKVGVDLLSSEVRSWLPHFSLRLVTNASLELPQEQRDLLEEWEAELEEFADRPITMLIVALRIWRDRRLIAKQLAAESTIATTEYFLVKQPGSAIVSILGATTHPGRLFGAKAKARARKLIKGIVKLLIFSGITACFVLAMFAYCLIQDGEINSRDIGITLLFAVYVFCFAAAVESKFNDY